VDRIGFRFQQPVDLTRSITVLREYHDLFYEDFQTFFPELRAHVAQ
jgi:hypothetical protein